MEIEPPATDAHALRALFERVALHRFKPLPGETSGAVVAGAKRTLLEAWAQM